MQVTCEASQLELGRHVTQLQNRMDFGLFLHSLVLKNQSLLVQLRELCTDGVDQLSHAALWLNMSKQQRNLIEAAVAQLRGQVEEVQKKSTKLNDVRQA